jgi:hypothetical protein
MFAPLLARLVLALFVAPFLLLVGAMAFALAAAQAGEHAGVAAAAVVVGGLLLGLDRWLRAVAASFGDPGAADHAMLGQQSPHPSMVRRGRHE